MPLSRWPNDGFVKVVEVRGKCFAWDYKYQRLGSDTPTRREDQFEVGQDVVGLQEPVVVVKTLATRAEQRLGTAEALAWLSAQPA